MTSIAATRTAALTSRQLHMGGSATQALERSMKRRRTESYSTAIETAFNFDQVLSSLQKPDEENFPSLSWDFESEEETDATTFDFSVSRKRSRNSPNTGLSRSKAVRSSLTSLASSSNVSTNVLSDKISQTLLAGAFEIISSRQACKPGFHASSSKMTLASLTRRSLIQNDDMKSRGLCGLAN